MGDESTNLGAGYALPALDTVHLITDTEGICVRFHPPWNGNNEQCIPISMVVSWQDFAGFSLGSAPRAERVTYHELQPYIPEPWTKLKYGWHVICMYVWLATYTPLD